MPKKLIHLTDKDLYQIVKNVIEEIKDTYKPPIILKEYYADDRQRCIGQIKSYLPRIMEHWALIMYVSTICIEGPVRHWCDEIRAFAKQLFPIATKGFDAQHGWKAIVEEVLRQLKLNPSNLDTQSIDLMIHGKFFADYPDADLETYAYVCDLCVPYLHNIIDCVIRQDSLGVEELLQQTLNDLGYEE